MKMSKTGGNVHLGPYASGSKAGDKKTGKHAAPKAVIGSHWETSGIPKIKGHQFKGPRGMTGNCKTIGK